MLTGEQISRIDAAAIGMLIDGPPEPPTEIEIYRCVVGYYHTAAAEILSYTEYCDAERRGYITLYANRLADVEIARYERNPDNYTADLVGRIP